MLERIFSLGKIGCSGSCKCGSPTTCCQSTCAPCVLPQKNLQLVATNVFDGLETYTLTYSPTIHTWVTTTCSNGLIFTLLCTGGQIELQVKYWISGSCPGAGTTAYCSNLRTNPFALTLASYTCSPLSLTFTETSATCPAVTSAGYTQFKITDTSPVSNPPGLMCQNICIYRCGNCPLGSASVSVYTSMGGTLLASGSIPSGSTSAGCVWLSWQGPAGSFYITASASGYTTYSGTSSLACSGTTNITLQQTVTFSTVTDSTFFAGGIGVAFSSNLNTTFPGAGLSGPGWYAINSITIPVCTTGIDSCPGSSLPIAYVLTCGSGGWGGGILVQSLASGCSPGTNWTAVYGLGAGGIETTVNTCSPTMVVITVEPTEVGGAAPLYQPCGGLGVPSYPASTITWTT